MSIRTIYVGMALTDAPEEFRTSFHDELKRQLRTLPDVEVLDFFWTSNGPTAGDDVEVYDLDHQHASGADLFVAMLDYPSLGLGMELMIRHYESPEAKSLFFAGIDRKVSRMVTGYLKRFNQPLYRYSAIEDIVGMVRETLTES